MGRVVALDYGERRIGVAVSDPLGITAQPLPFIPNAQAILGLKALFQDYEVDLILLGWPLNLKGEATGACDKVAAFQTQVEANFNTPIRRVDERMSTKGAERVLRELNLSGTKRRQQIDSQAAVFLLEGYLSGLAKM